MRTVLAFIAALLSAAGPGVCCCLPQAFAQTPAAPQAVEPVKSTCPFCPACHDEAPAGDESPAAPKPVCPCAERLLTAPVAAPDAPVFPDLDNPDVSQLDTLPAFGTDPSSNVVGPQSDMPFLPPKDRLMVHHALRL